MNKEYSNWQRNPDGDQPRLVSQCIGHGQEKRAIPAQIGFVTDNGTEIQISYHHALELGLIEPQVIPTERIDVYGKDKL